MVEIGDHALHQGQLLGVLLPKVGIQRSALGQRLENVEELVNHRQQRTVKVPGAGFPSKR